MTTHFPHGISTVEASDLLGKLPVPDPRDPIKLFDDFHVFDPSNSEYTVSTPDNSTISGKATLGGALLFSTTADANSNPDIIPITAFEFVVGKRLWCEIAVKVSSDVATTNTVQIHAGLQDGLGIGPFDGWQVQKNTGEDDYYLNIRSGGFNQLPVDTISLAQFAIDEPVSFGFFWDGKDTIETYVNSVLAVSTLMDPDGSNPSLPQLPQGLLAPSMGTRGNGAASTVECNYLLAFEDR